ncbi:MAG TPA: TIGR04282 family arsenosugar biosynthesis glycosyltransferase [Longimicrobium sp.]
MVTLVFVRAPVAGQVKTRLAAALGAEGALRVYRRLAEHTLREARALGGEVRVHFTPEDAEPAVRAWLGDGPRYLPQSAGDLGARMEAAFRAAFEDGADRVVIIGSDLPELSVALLGRAFDALDSHPAVIGPARDGGYYLLGMRTMIDGLFDGIPWSTDDVLARTLERLGAAGIHPALLDTLSDVDEVDDLPAGWAEWARAEAAR